MWLADWLFDKLEILFGGGRAFLFVSEVSASRFALLEIYSISSYTKTILVGSIKQLKLIQGLIKRHFLASCLLNDTWTSAVKRAYEGFCCPFLFFPVP